MFKICILIGRIKCCCTYCISLLCDACIKYVTFYFFQIFFVFRRTGKSAYFKLSNMCIFYILHINYVITCICLMLSQFYYAHCLYIFLLICVSGLSFHLAVFSCWLLSFGCFYVVLFILYSLLYFSRLKLL